MFLQFDDKKVHLQIICGSLEKYKPTKEIKEIQEKVTELQTKVTEFREKVAKPLLEEIVKKVNEENKKFIEKYKKE